MHVLIVTSDREIDSSLTALGQSVAGRAGTMEWCRLMSPGSDLDAGYHSVDHVYYCRKSGDRPWLAEQVRIVLGDLTENFPYDFILLENSRLGTEVCSMMACQTGGEAITNIVDAKLKDGRFTVTKPVYSSNLNAVYRIKKFPCFATLRSGTNADCRPLVQRRGLIVEKQYSFIESDQIVYLDQHPAEEKILDHAGRVVVAGRGIRHKHDLELIQLFADGIGAEIGGSRPLVMSGLLPARRMIGQSGKIIAPELCIAVGVSGATPLSVGIAQAGKIIAVNKDREAPIFKMADVGIVDDYHAVLEFLMK